MNQISKMFDSKRKRKSDDGSVLRKKNEPGRRDKDQVKRKYRPTNRNAKA